jgi:hypothetical protein
MSKPKLALIPSGYKSGKVYSILPNDASGDFDFTRQSIGTRVRKDGLIEEAKTEGSITNILQRSEEFNNSYWSKQGGCTVTSNTTLAPNGTFTADTLSGATGTSVSGTVLRRNVVISGISTLSIYVKSLGSTNFTIYIRNGGNGQVFSQSITPNSDWQRVTLTTDPANGQVFFGNTNGDVAIWGAMLSEGALSDYIKTEGSSETKTVETFTDVPRLDWLNSNCPSLLLEPQRTNSILQSNDPSGANWTDPLSRWNLLTDTTTAPDGRNVRIIELKESGGSLIRLSGLSISAGTYTVSFYIKDIDGNLSGGSVDIGDEGSGAPTPAFSDVGSDWVRLTRTITTTGTKTFVDLQPSFTGSTNKVAIWGAQVEAGSYATSLIKTEASAVTRLKDDCHLLNQTLFTDYPFTVYAKAKVEAVGNTIFSIYGGASNKYLSVWLQGVNQIYVLRRDAINNDSDFYSFNYSVGDTIRIAIAFINDTSYKFYINGTEIGNVTSGSSIPFDHNDIILGQFRISADTGQRNSIEEFRVYDYTLTDAELTELTTL